jgi:hypothetical protein
MHLLVKAYKEAQQTAIDAKREDLLEQVPRVHLSTMFLLMYLHLILIKLEL